MRRIPFFAALCIAASPALGAVEGVDLFQGGAVSVAPGKKGTVAIFLSEKCPCSNAHLARIRQLKKDFPDFAFVAVHSNSDEPVAESAAYFRRAKLGFPVVQDEKSRLADQFKALKTPHAFLLATDGTVLFHGGVTNSVNGDAADRQPLREALDDATAGRAVHTPTARTLGCVIAR